MIKKEDVYTIPAPYTIYNEEEDCEFDTHLHLIDVMLKKLGEGQCFYIPQEDSHLRYRVKKFNRENEAGIELYCWKMKDGSIRVKRYPADNPEGKQEE